MGRLIQLFWGDGIHKQLPYYLDLTQFLSKERQRAQRVPFFSLALNRGWVDQECSSAYPLL